MKGTGFTGCEETLHSAESNTSGAKALMGGVGYGPAKAVP
jgi:hypothetical protein